MRVNQPYNWKPFLGVASLHLLLQIRTLSCYRAGRGHRTAPACGYEEHGAWKLSIKQPLQAYKVEGHSLKIFIIR